MIKSPKLPPISNATKLLSFDLETNGLHGQAFAIGAVLMGADGETINEFTARTNIEGLIDPWVEKNVLPAIADVTITHSSYEDMREDFWAWYLENKPKADYVLVNNGYPVEYRFLLDCQEANLDERYWQHPFPILDLTSLLVQHDHKTPIDKTKLTNGEKYSLHHPLHDAKVAALTAFDAFHQSGLLN